MKNGGLLSLCGEWLLSSTILWSSSWLRVDLTVRLPTGSRQCSLALKDEGDGVASDEDACRAPPCGGLLVTSDWEKTSGGTQNVLQGLYILPGLGMPWYPQEGVGKCRWRDGCLVWPAITTTRPRISGRRWMDENTDWSGMGAYVDSAFCQVKLGPVLLPPPDNYCPILCRLPSWLQQCESLTRINCFSLNQKDVANQSSTLQYH